MMTHFVEYNSPITCTGRAVQPRAVVVLDSSFNQVAAAGSSSLVCARGWSRAENQENSVTAEPTKWFRTSTPDKIQTCNNNLRGPQLWRESTHT